MTEPVQERAHRITSRPKPALHEPPEPARRRRPSRRDTGFADEPMPWAVAQADGSSATALLSLPALGAPVALPLPEVRGHTLPIELGPSAAYAAAKRALDILLAASLLLLLAPMLLVVALLIKCTDGGPIFFRQRRVGQFGQEFDFFKFRSMIVNAEALRLGLLACNKHGNSITFKMSRDPRVTWIGRILRKTSIDELPQLWNVLKGEMTLVGPRPAVPGEVVQYDAYERRRLAAVPGLTCIWQVNGRSDLDFRQQVELDLDYIRERTLWLDLKLLLLTIPAVLSGRGAY
jgi:lipopolysaccharide/colanic/teichoic acid biosynthesis glycosyltransferase